ncbi:MAG: ATP-dependent helicase [Candidatus Paceibacteria bacterium]
MHDSLSPQQKEAVFHKEGALLVLAGAGAGKTRVVTHRIAELIRQGAAPEQILAVTFTNKAAGEMRERVGALLKTELALSPYDSPRGTPFIGTFHALSLHIIRAFHRHLALPARPNIFDRSDSLKAVKEAIRNAGFDPKELEPRRVLSIMSRAKGDALDVEGFRAERASSYIDEAVADVWEEYDKLLKNEKALDFDDILLAAFHLLDRNADVRKHFQGAWEYLHVDEYQDTNRVQYELIRLLAARHGNLCVVGDDFQNIYSWRGASIEHILNFEREFPGAAVVPLVQNYRSTKTIIQAANDAIAKNTRRLDKELYTENEDGEPIAVIGMADEADEARVVTGECARLIERGASPNDIAVLYRANFQSRALEEAFLAAGVPYQVLGTRFFERHEVKNALAYLALAQNGESANTLSRVMNIPTRGIGKVTLAKVLSGQTAALSAAQKQRVDGFFAIVEAIRAKIPVYRTSELVKYALEKSGLRAMYEKGKGEDEERLENLRELVSVATKYDAFESAEGLARLLEEAALQSDQDELAAERAKKDGVKLMTVHAAKGLEFGYVFVTGLEEGLFPHEKDGMDADDPEEERRLFYVALTRAKRRAYLTHALTRRIFGTRIVNVPSTFITEMDPSLCEVLAMPEGEGYDAEDAIIL